MQRFLHDIALNPNNAAILARWHRLDLPQAWLVAGCLFQAVWNLRWGLPPGHGVQDHDLFYFDPADTSEQAERDVQAHAETVLGDLGIRIEVANQARVHHWYPAYFGQPCPPLTSTLDGVGRFLVLETCVGVRPRQVLAPFGVEGVYAGTLSPNPRTPHADLFAQKVASYRARWPGLRVQSGAAAQAAGEGRRRT